MTPHDIDIKSIVYFIFITLSAVSIYASLSLLDNFPHSSKKEKVALSIWMVISWVTLLTNSLIYCGELLL